MYAVCIEGHDKKGKAHYAQLIASLISGHMK